ncbi:F-box only protein 36 isoform X4 [Prionailurus iriomotensis]
MVIFRWWKISLRSEHRSAKPGEAKDTHEEFLENSHLQGLCMSDELWEKIVHSCCDTITPDMRALAKDMGWRQMFFTNKLQLQRQIRKRKQKQGSHRTGHL